MDGNSVKYPILPLGAIHLVRTQISGEGGQAKAYASYISKKNSYIFAYAGRKNPSVKGDASPVTSKKSDIAESDDTNKLRHKWQMKGNYHELFDLHLK